MVVLTFLNHYRADVGPLTALQLRTTDQFDVDVPVVFMSVSLKANQVADVLVALNTRV